MNKTKYNVRHIRCNMHDFHADAHRFRFEYEGKEHIATCYCACQIEFDAELPENVECEICDIIYNKIDTEEKQWRYPEAAYRIANEYCAAEFAS